MGCSARIKLKREGLRAVLKKVLSTSWRWRGITSATLGLCGIFFIGGICFGDVLSLGNILVPPLQSQFKRANIGDGSSLTGLIVPGGGPERYREAGRLARKYPHVRLVISDTVEVLLYLGGDIAPSRVLLETQARSTYENAIFMKALVKPQSGERWLLVTSAAHMPRAVGVFRKAGLDVEPWPVYDLEGVQPLPYAVARHEWFGLLGYWALGRTSAFFPAPR